MDHQEQVLKLEKSLLDSRMKLQLESDEKIQLMESEAEQKAAKYLADHTATIERENRQLQQELYKLTVSTSRLIARKEQLVQENKDLEKRQKIASDVVRIRLEKIKRAEEKQEELKQKRRQEISSKRDYFMSKVKTIGDREELEREAVGDWYDFDSEDD
jgi:hypothetical protein